ncbi:MAG: WD40/YVTN/BNR-like repeat-containing protein [Gemmatimonadales bacterium]
MRRPIQLPASARAVCALLAVLTVGAATPIKPDLLSGLVWRNVGPFRGGRISAASGAIGEAGTFYVGLPSAGVWKTTSAGETWFPVFDAVRDVSSVGAVAVAPSNANVVYVGTGDQVTGGAINEGNGVYKSVDAGKTWKHLGLDATKQIPAIIVDPRNADVVLIAAQGDLHAKSDTRGVFRSTDGGSTWTKTLYVADSIGIQALAIAHDRPDVVFATTVRHYAPPPPSSGIVPPPAFGGGNPLAQQGPTGTSVYKSTDGGITWKELTGGGLPRIVGRTSIAVAMNTNAERVYLITNNGLYRSDDGGGSWRRMAADDDRISNGQGGYNSGVFVDPKNPDVVYTFSTASYKSTDGGNTFTGFRGAPGGDDAQAGWIDPTDGRRILLGYDQGAIVSLDGGDTWSSWYNQSTEQVYHISTDNSFPYWIYATQQDAGAIRTRGRGNLGAVTPLDWNPVNGWEWGTIVPDPLNANIVYSSGNGINKISYPSEQWISVSPAANPMPPLIATSSQPLVWAPWNQHELFAGFQFLMATTDGGAHWKKLSPDLGYAKGVKPPPDTTTPVPGTPRGAIETIAASPVGKGTIWVGTNNGLIKVTKDEGVTWEDASIPNLPFPGRALVEGLDVSPTVAGEAYAAVDVARTGDYAPYVFRTRDFGKTWTKIIGGLATNQPNGSAARVVRADPKRAGLLYAGTESGMYVSFDDGDNWQSLQQNLPVTSYRAIVFNGNDVIVGTYGRGIFVLDDGAVLRQMTPAVADEAVHLFKPDPTVRVRRNVGYNTPFPREVPHALNPPDGMIVYYALGSRASGEITLDVVDSSGTRVRHMSSIAPAPVREAARPPHPNFWVAAPEALPAAAGLNRTNWDLRHDAPPAFTHSFEINANPGLTPTTPEGALVAPGTYTLKLTVNGKSYTQTATVVNDPRSPATTAGVRAQHALLMKLQEGMKTAWDGSQQVTAMRTALAGLVPGADSTSDAAKAIRAFRAKIDSVGGNTGGGRGFGGRGGATPPPSFVSVHRNLVGQFTAQENGDLAPTEPMLQGFASACRDLTKAVVRWQAINATDVPALNAVLAKNGKSPVTASTLAAPKC